MALELKNIYKIYPNGFQAITDFNLEIKDKEFIVLVGPSGCGKSTTLRMIAGLEDITHGTFSIDGKVVNALPPKNRGIAMVFQSYALYPTMTVYENLAFSLDLAGFDEDVIDARVKKTAAILGLGEYLDRQPRNLSGGQRQRVALGRAIIRHAKIFLMDEPLSNLDARQRVTMRSELIRIHRQVGATTIYVTHDQVEAMTMADRIVCMDFGVIKQVGTPEELYFHPKNLFVAGFIGDPPMNFISGSLKGVRFFTPDKSFDFDLTGLKPELLAKLAGKKIVLGYRPEHAKFGPYAADPQYLRLEGQVEINEMLGDTQNVYLVKNGIKSIVKTPPETLVSIGDKFSFFLDKADLHLFDEDTQDAIE